MSVVIIASVLGSIAFILLLQLLGFLCSQLCLKRQQKRAKDDNILSRVSVISDIQPYGDYTINDSTGGAAGGVDDMNAYATFGDVTQTGGENVYFKETKVQVNGENVYYKETKVDGGENVYFKEAETNGDIYDKNLSSQEIPRPGDIVEYAVPDLSKKKSRKDKETVAVKEGGPNASSGTALSMSIIV